MINKIITLLKGFSSVILMAIACQASATSEADTKTSSNTTPTMRQLSAQIRQLQKELQQLKRAQAYKKTQLSRVQHKSAIKKSKKQKSVATNKSSDQLSNKLLNSSHIHIGTYFKWGRSFDGSQLLIRQSDTRLAAAMLLQKVRWFEECQRRHLLFGPYPQIILSGKITGTYSFASSYIGKHHSSIDGPGFDAQTEVIVSPWIMGFAEIKFDPQDKTDLHLSLPRAFVTFGNLVQFPVYAVVGRDYLSFGRYNDYMISATLPQKLAETVARKIEVGYQQKGTNRFHSELYVYQGKQEANTNDATQWGANVGYEYDVGRFNGEFGAGYFSNIADSAGLQTALAIVKAKHTNVQVPAYDLYSTVTFKPITINVEYISVTRAFNSTLLAYHSSGARPSAYNVQVGYGFTIKERPLSIALNYGGTQQAVALGLPQHVYAAVVNMTLWRHTLLAIEYRHEINYPHSTADSFNSQNNHVEKLGKSSNAVTAQFNVYY